LTVSEVAEGLGVCDAAVYKLCATGALQHTRVLNSIRIAADWVEAFVANRTPRA
jgi:excisionase family DNA binding protein